MARIYLASSWRNTQQPDLVASLRRGGAVMATREVSFQILADDMQDDVALHLLVIEDLDGDPMIELWQCGPEAFKRRQGERICMPSSLFGAYVGQIVRRLEKAKRELAQTSQGGA